MPPTPTAASVSGPRLPTKNLSRNELNVWSSIVTTDGHASIQTVRWRLPCDSRSIAPSGVAADAKGSPAILSVTSASSRSSCSSMIKNRSCFPFRPRHGTASRCRVLLFNPIAASRVPAQCENAPAPKMPPAPILGRFGPQPPILGEELGLPLSDARAVSVSSCQEAL